MKAFKFVTAGLLTMCVSLPLHADIISTSGQVVIIAAPSNAQVNQNLESNTVAPLFTEQTDLVLGSNLTVDFTTTGLHNSNPVGPLPDLLAGTDVNSYYLVTDPVGSDPNNLRSFSGSITFSTDILGVIALDPEFASSNSILGHPGTLYSSSGVGLELGSPDNFTLSADRHTISFAFASNTAADDLRIVTSAVPAVPEPGTLLLLGSGLLGILGAIRRKFLS